MRKGFACRPLDPVKSKRRPYHEGKYLINWACLMTCTPRISGACLGVGSLGGVLSLALVFGRRCSASHCSRFRWAGSKSHGI